ncbi:MAG: peptidylprolyl isomerase [bacterium]|nr:peptidylprolyl isomerase [bacterium]
MIINYKNRLELIFILVIFLWTTLGCSNNDPQTLIAKVGKKELHLNDLMYSNEPIQDEEWMGMVNRWTDKQLLIQKAQQMDLHKTEIIKKKLMQLENELLIQLLIDSLIQVEFPSEDKIKQYYETNKDLWTTKTTEVRGWVWRAQDQSTIQSLWRQTRTLLAPAGGEPFDWTPIERLGPFKEELARVSIGIITQPKKWGNEWLFIQLDNRRNAGYLKPLPEVRQELIAMYQSEQMERKRDSLIHQLKQEAIKKKKFFQLSENELITRKKDYEMKLKYESEKQKKKAEKSDILKDTIIENAK